MVKAFWGGGHKTGPINIYSASPRNWKDSRKRGWYRVGCSQIGATRFTDRVFVEHGDSSN